MLQFSCGCCRWFLLATLVLPLLGLLLVAGMVFGLVTWGHGFGLLNRNGSFPNRIQESYISYIVEPMRDLVFRHFP